LESFGYFQIDNTALSVIAGISNRLITWTLPVILLVKNPFYYLKLRHNFSKGVIVGTLVGCLLVFIRILSIYLWKGCVDIDLKLNPHIWFGEIIFVGLSEEVVFRGLILQKIQESSNFWLANIVSSALFILIHVPYWILIQKYELDTAMLQHSLSIMWISLLLGFVLKKSKSLWACMIIHSINNFMSWTVN
jgi:membrane protease YdiL (CAAX protease family)